MDALSALAPFLQLGAGGLLSLGILMILTGRLVPGGTVERLLAARDRIIEQQQGTIDRQEVRADLTASQITQLLESGKTSAHVLEEIRRLVEKRPGEGA